MNTFLPCNDFATIARILDPERLNRQISETVTLARSLWAYKKLLDACGRQLPWGFQIAPVLNLWCDKHGRVYLDELWDYQRYLGYEWLKHHRGIPHGSLSTLNWKALIGGEPDPKKVEWPEAVLESHRSKLLTKDPAYYRRAFERTGLPVPKTGLGYVWEGPSYVQPQAI